jgi:hypothetical protein
MMDFNVSLLKQPNNISLWMAETSGGVNMDSNRFNPFGSFRHNGSFPESLFNVADKRANNQVAAPTSFSNRTFDDSKHLYMNMLDRSDVGTVKSTRFWQDGNVVKPARSLTESSLECTRRSSSGTSSGSSLTVDYRRTDMDMAMCCMESSYVLHDSLPVSVPDAPVIAANLSDRSHQVSAHSKVGPWLQGIADETQHYIDLNQCYRKYRHHLSNRRSKDLHNMYSPIKNKSRSGESKQSSCSRSSRNSQMSRSSCGSQRSEYSRECFSHGDHHVNVVDLTPIREQSFQNVTSDPELSYEASTDQFESLNNGFHADVDLDETEYCKLPSVQTRPYRQRAYHNMSIDSDATAFMQGPIVPPGVTSSKNLHSKRRQLAKKLKKVGKYFHKFGHSSVTMTTLAVL